MNLKLVVTFLLCFIVATIPHAVRGTGNDRDAVALYVQACYYVFLSIAACAGELDREQRLRSQRRDLQFDGPRPRREEENKRQYYWEEDGHTGRKKVRCKDPDNAAPWQRFLVPPEQLGPAKRKDFRELFRIPHDMFWIILRDAQTSGGFSDTSSSVDGSKRGDPLPLGLKIMNVLRINALGSTLSAHKHESGVGASTMRTFFHPFIAWFVAEYYHQHVKWPVSEEEVASLEKLYARQGMPGCIASMDGVHVAWDNCPAPKTAVYRGKEGYPTLGFNVCVSHNRRILNVEGGYEGTRNDKTTVKTDAFVMAVKSMTLFTQYAYEILRFSGLPFIMLGVWIMVDGGYLQWPVTISPYAPPVCELTSAFTKQ